MIEDDKLNPIEQAFESIEGASPEISKELFLASPTDLILKSDLKYPENVAIVKLQFADRFLEQSGIGPIFSPIIVNFLEANISLDRQSRKEFVEAVTRKMNNFQIPGEFNKIEESRK